ncbi:MAG: four helix bundle protein [Ruminococcaceae bacterium]|nr:four helix bundle protein [Oscillospiraceae bacterium]
MELIEQLETNTVLNRAFELIDIVANITTRNKNADTYLIKPHLSQISRSSGSIAANISEVHNFLSHKFKYSKLSISLSECRETIIHNKVLYKMGIITEAEYHGQ